MNHSETWSEHPLARIRPVGDHRSADVVGTSVVRAPQPLDLWLARLEMTLHRRFEREESRCGFLAFICCAAPRYTTFADKLRGDHRRLLAAVRTLRVSVRGSGPSPRNIADHQALLETIERHESLEREVLRDALID